MKRLLLAVLVCLLAATAVAPAQDSRPGTFKGRVKHFNTDKPTRVVVKVGAKRVRVKRLVLALECGNNAIFPEVFYKSVRSTSGRISSGLSGTRAAVKVRSTLERGGFSYVIDFDIFLTLGPRKVTTSYNAYLTTDDGVLQCEDANARFTARR